MRNFGKVILGTFTSALRRKNGQPPPNANQLQEYNKAISCVRNLSDFYLMTKYSSHTDMTISYLQEYLRVFHETKDVFLHYRAGKKTKRLAAEAHKSLLEEQTLQAAEQVLTTSERARLRQENACEFRELIDDILTEGGHYNFPKMHLISHYAVQITTFVALNQYSTDICEPMHKGLKDAFRRSNQVNALDQIITTYTRDHTFAMKDLTIAAWNRIRGQGDTTQSMGRQSQHSSGQVFLKLQGKL